MQHYSWGNLEGTPQQAIVSDRILLKETWVLNSSVL